MEYGFLLPETMNQCDLEVKNEEKILRRIKKWDKIRSTTNEYLKYRKMKRFIRKGIPSEIREDVWMKCSGAEEQMVANPSLYEDLLTKEIDENILKIITADVARTFSDNENFKNPAGDNSKVTSLTKILTAFSVHNPTVGYCQGLNYVAAMLLLVMQSEEKAFWLFHTLITRIVQPYYIPGMEAMQVDCFVLEELIRKKVSKVHQVILDLDTSCIVLCTKWFVCLFIDVLPAETTIRILDCLLFEGDKILFRVALTIVKMNVKDLLSVQTFSDLAKSFQSAQCNDHVTNCCRFMKRIFNEPNPLPYKLIKRLRKKCLTKLETPILEN